MNAGTLEIEMMANIARLQKDMDEARRVVGSTMSGIKDSVAIAQGALVGLGIAGAAGMFVARVKEAIDYADKLDELSQKAGITTENLSQLQYAAKMGGAETETFNTAMKKLNQSIAGGLAGDKEKVAWFKTLGVTFVDTQGQALGADAVLLQLADTFAKSKDGAGKAAGAVALMGKAGDEMIPLLNGGAQSIRGLMTEADKMGLTISGDFAKAAGDFNDSLDRIDAQSRKLTIQLAGDFVKGVGEAMKAMADATVEGGKLAGILAGVQTLLTGNDRYKNDKAMVEQTEKMLSLEKQISDIYAKPGQTRGDLFRVEELQDQLKDVNAELKTTQAYRKVLTDQDDAAAAAAAKLQAAREGNPINPPRTGGGSTESEYEKLVKRIQERIAASSEALRVGRELSAAEAFEVKTLQDMDQVKGKLSATERLRLTALLETARVQAAAERDQKISIDENTRYFEGLVKTTEGLREQNKAEQESAARVGLTAQALVQLDAEKVEALALDKLARASVADVIDLSGRTGDIYREQAVLIRQVGASKQAAYGAGIQKSMDDALRAIAEETGLLQLTNAEREVAIRLRDAERLGLEKGGAAFEDYAAKLRASVGKKSEVEKAQEGQIELWQGIDNAARDTFVNIGKNGTNVFDKLKDSLRSGLYSLLYDMTVKKWLINISTQVSGAAVSEKALGSGVGGLWGAISSLFGGGSSGSFVPDQGLVDNAANFAAMVGLPARAMGGPVLGGTSYMVGENGPERFTPASSGSITPNDKLGGAGGLTFAPVTNIKVDGGMNQAEVYSAVSKALDARDREWNEHLQKMGVTA